MFDFDELDDLYESTEVHGSSSSECVECSSREVENLTKLSSETDVVPQSLSSGDQPLACAGSTSERQQTMPALQVDTLPSMRNPQEPPTEIEAKEQEHSVKSESDKQKVLVATAGSRVKVKEEKYGTIIWDGRPSSQYVRVKLESGWADVFKVSDVEAVQDVERPPSKKRSSFSSFCQSKADRNPDTISLNTRVQALPGKRVAGCFEESDRGTVTRLYGENAQRDKLQITWDGTKKTTQIEKLKFFEWLRIVDEESPKENESTEMCEKMPEETRSAVGVTQASSALDSLLPSSAVVPRKPPPAASIGQYYEAVQRVLMREQEDLQSSLIGYMPHGSLMVVLELPKSKNSRRIRVCVEQGIRGWVSLSKETGERLLKPRTVAPDEAALLNSALQQSSSKDHASEKSAKSSSSQKCDKCDGPHATDCCPFFKKAREDHKDAWAHYGDKNPHKMGADGGNVVVHKARVVPQPGDGSCLFHSLCYGFERGTAAASGLRMSAQQLRRDIAKFIETHRDLKISGDTIEEWIQWDQNTSAAAYAKRMAFAGWGGGIEMACFSIMKGVNVHVYESKHSMFKRISCFDAPRAKGTVHVLYQGGVHYDALVPLSNPVKGT